MQWGRSARWVQVAVLVLAAVAACDPVARKVSSVAGPEPGCVDATLAQVHDLAAAGPIAMITLTNRCDRLIRVDFDEIAARGRMIDGARVPLAPREPDAESRSMLLRPGEAVREVIEFRLPAESWPLELCVETTHVEVGAPAATVAPRCLDVTGPEAIVALAN